MLFATPGMLHGGTSLEVFKAWAPDPKNLVLLPSYQVGQREEAGCCGVCTCWEYIFSGVMHLGAGPGKGLRASML